MLGTRNQTALRDRSLALKPGDVIDVLPPFRRGLLLGDVVTLREGNSESPLRCGPMLVQVHIRFRLFVPA